MKRKWKKPTFDRLESAIMHLESALADTDLSECQIAIKLALANLTGDGKYYPEYTIGEEQ
jgi:O-acetylhomoserine/O-acetylserine sulfhydrylase-like pyridoxal-dependent enzyme